MALAFDSWTRRAVLGGIAGSTALGCGLSGRADPPRAAPAPSPPPNPAPAPGPAPTGPSATVFRPGPANPHSFEFAATPDWFRDAPGLSCPGPRTAGSALLLFTEGDDSALSKRISHFRELPSLLEAARAVGSDIVYIVDYYEGHPGERPTRYCWNKSTYVARADMGGPEAFKEGIAAVQAAGGRVILYLEPFVIEKNSELGQDKGLAWSLKDARGRPPEQPYPDSYKICPANQPFVDHMLAMVRQLIGEYGADGVHLDSYGFQRGWECHDRSHGHAPGQAQVFDRAMKDLVRQLKAEATRIKADSVLMCEGPKVADLYQWVSASQDWGINTLVDRWCWSTAGQAAVFTCGWSLDDVHQILALGHRLSLSDLWWSTPPGDQTLSAWFDRRLPDPIPDKQSERFRRFYAEEFFRKMHRYRNAGIVLGRGMPTLGEATPRRGQAVADFKSYDGMANILRRCQALAPKIDAALAGAGPLPSPAEHLKTLLTARRRFSPFLRGSSIEAVDVGHDSVAAYRFAKGQRRGFTAANVHYEPVEITLTEAKGAYRELVADDDVAVAGGEITLTLPPHSLRMLIPGR